jgi:hypothetical protein
MHYYKKYIECLKHILSPVALALGQRCPGAFFVIFIAVYLASLFTTSLRLADSFANS